MTTPIAAKSSEDPSDREVIAAALTHRRVFWSFLGATALTAVLSYFVWSTGNSAVDAEKRRSAKELAVIQTKLADSQTAQARAERELLELKEKVADRFLDHDKFVAALSESPKLGAEILFAENDTESFVLATTLEAWLGAGGAKWPVSRPTPFTEAHVVPNTLVFPNSPLIIRIGGWRGQIVLQTTRLVLNDDMIGTTERAAVGALRKAIIDSGGKDPGIAFNPTIPIGTVRIIVGPK